MKKVKENGIHLLDFKFMNNSGIMHKRYSDRIKRANLVIFPVKNYGKRVHKDMSANFIFDTQIGVFKRRLRHNPSLPPCIVFIYFFNLSIN